MSTACIYWPNGERKSVADARGYLSAYVYDGLDRLKQLQFPSSTAVNTANPGDYEQYGYDADGDLMSKRLRDGQVINYSFDGLDRMSLKDIPSATATDVYYGYDGLGRRKYAHYGSAGGSGVDWTYDNADRTLTEATNGRTVSYAYNQAGALGQITWPEGFYVKYLYDVLNRTVELRENGGTNGATVLNDIAYDALGRLQERPRPRTPPKRPAERQPPPLQMQIARPMPSRP